MNRRRNFKSESKVGARKPHRSGRLSTVDLFVPTSLDRLILKLKLLFAFF